MKFLPELWFNFGSNQGFDGLLRRRLFFYRYVELQSEAIISPMIEKLDRMVREHTTYSSSSVSWATSGIVMVPSTSSSSLVEPLHMSVWVPTQ